MMNLLVLIEEIHIHPAGKRSTIARSNLEFNESVHFPFESLISSFKLLYPNKQLCFTFSIH